jgi:predicted MFS family arabinose efflux permease
MQNKLTKRISLSPNLIPATACMLLMLQGYLIAPLSRTLAKDFGSALPPLAVPAFAIPFAIAAAGTVLLGLRADFRKCLLISLAMLCLGSIMLSITNSADVFLLVRTLTGFGTGIMLPSALLLTIWNIRKKNSSNQMVLVIFALAAGMTFGPSLGGWLNDSMGWRCLYRLTGMTAAMLFFIYFLQDATNRPQPITLSVIKTAERSKTDRKSRYIYSFVYLTGVFHSGVFVWISHYFTTQYGLDEFHIATELFIFGLPGFVVSLLLYRYHLDKKVINILYVALGLTAAGLMALMGNLPLWLAECLLGIMSVGFGCSQPLFIGILKLPPRSNSILRPAAIGSGLLFAGYGSGPLMMIALLSVDLGVAMYWLIGLVLALAYISAHVWKASWRFSSL